MAFTAHDALLDGPRIRSDLEHFEVVICFEHEEVSVAEVEADGIGDVAEVGRKADLNSFCAKAEADGVDGIMWDRKAVNFDIADGEGSARLERFDDGLILAPIDRRCREARDVHGPIRPGSIGISRDADEPGDVVGVLVSNEDAVQIVELFADRVEARHDFFSAQASVHEDACTPGGDKRRIARTAGGENADFDDARPS